MGVNRGVPSRTSEVLSIAVGDVLSCLGITETLGQTEVDDVHVVLFLANTNEEVVRLDVSVQEVTRVHELNSLQLN